MLWQRKVEKHRHTHYVKNIMSNKQKQVCRRERGRQQLWLFGKDEKKRTDAEEWECLCSGSFHRQTAAKQKLEKKTQTQRDCLSSGVCDDDCVYFKSLKKLLLLPAAKQSAQETTCPPTHRYRNRAPGAAQKQNSTLSLCRLMNEVWPWGVTPQILFSPKL